MTAKSRSKSVRIPRLNPPVQKQRIGALVRWFIKHGRVLAWRTERTGYSALVAELMLHQTQVSRICERFPQFMKRFPTVQALAEADEHDLLLHWQGLGYYRRARLLHNAAKKVVADFSGEVPASVSELMSLPGVGRYTAGAIASIVFSARAPIVDGNVNRVLSRWFGRHGSAAESSDWCWKMAERLVQIAPKPGVFNESLMELGALVCTPFTPKCHACPVARWCEARQQGLQNEIPSPKPAAKKQVQHHHAILLTHNGKVLVEQRATNGMWAGMWQTPTIESRTRLPLQKVKTLYPAVRGLRKCGCFNHVTTHRSIRFHIYRGTATQRQGVWKTAAQLKALPISSAHRKVLGHLPLVDE